MIRQIIYREILENILSLRFLLSLLLAISLFAAAGFVFVSKYRQELQDYWKDTNENLSSLSTIYFLGHNLTTTVRKCKGGGLIGNG